MRLYHHPFSSNARRAVMTAIALGVDVELVLVDLAKGEQRKPEFLKLNPAGKVPVLEDGGLVLPESHAIMTYLADRTPGQTLYPTDVAERADVNRWLFWSAAHFQPSVSVLGWERFVKKILGQGEPDPAQVARGEAMVTEHARLLDAHLAGKQWLAQGRLTLADIAVCTPLMMTQNAGLPVLDYPNLQAWFGRMQELPAWKKTGV